MMTSLKIDKEFNKLIPPLRVEEFDGLKESIKKEGCRDPLIVWNNIIIDGHNRYKICRENNIKFDAVNKLFDNRDDAKIWIIKNQFDRRNISKYDRSVLALKLEGIIAKKAKERQIRKPKSVPPILAEQNIETRDELAKIAGISHGTLDKVKVIEKEAPKEVKEQIREHKISINKAYQHLGRDKRDKKRMEDLGKDQGLTKKHDIFDSISKLESDQFKARTIVIDPPWDWSDVDAVDQMGKIRPSYTTIPYDKLLTLPIDKISNDNAHIYLWITNHIVYNCKELLESWGFRYITLLTWCKKGIGVGNYFRNNTEQIAFGVRGSLELRIKDQGTWFEADKTKHSIKPDIFFDIIERCSYPPYLEIFGRKDRSNWKVLGIY